MDNCPHDLAERVSACADGYCPLCMEKKLASIPKSPTDKPTKGVGDHIYESEDMINDAKEDKPAEGLARVEYNQEYGYGVLVDVFKQRPIAAFYHEAEAHHMADKINKAHAFIVKPFREKAEKLEKELSRVKKCDSCGGTDLVCGRGHFDSIRTLERRAFEDCSRLEKDRDAWKEKATILQKNLEDFGDHHIRMMSLPGPWKEDAERLAEALKMAERLLSVKTFDAPEDIEDLSKIEEAILAHEKLKGGA